VSSKSEVRQSRTIVWQMMSVETARTAVGWTTIECYVHCCATRCPGSDTAEMTSVESWTSAQPTCSWCTVQQAASAVSEAASWRLTVKALVERYVPRCSGLAGASEWRWMERHAAQSCSSQFSRESGTGCMQASVLSPASVEFVCGRSHTCGNFMIVLRLMLGYRKSGDNQEWRRNVLSSMQHLSNAARHCVILLLLGDWLKLQLWSTNYAIS